MENTKRTLADFLKRFKEITRTESNRVPFRVALLMSGTTKGLKEVLAVQCCEAGIDVDIYESGYGQYAQEILRPDSGLYTFNPDLVVLFLDMKTFVGTDPFLLFRLSDTDREAWQKEKYLEIGNYIEKLKTGTRATILAHDMEVPAASPFGILEGKQAYGAGETVRELNRHLQQAYKKDPRVFLFPFDAFASRIGKDRMVDDVMYYLGDIRLSMEWYPALASEYLSYIKPLANKIKKCLVLDLDNTLWGGIIGEDGMEGIRLGPTPEGRAYWELQHYILSLFHRGVILAVNSKNNPEDALRVFREHPSMVLREEHFAAMQINWDDKATNMRRLAEDIGIGTDSFVFLDDDPVNRDLVQTELPEITVVEMPMDPSGAVRMLTRIDDFNTLAITEEDRQKGRMYAAERLRTVFEKEAGDMAAYLKGLEIVVSIRPADQWSIPRVAQLTQKTNQWNMTTRRYLEDDIRRFAEDPRFLVVALQARDRFGEHGIVGVAIMEKGERAWRIDTLLMSCRVLGRGIEETLLSYIFSTARAAGAMQVHGEFIPTPKNGMAKDFYAQQGFVPRETSPGSIVFAYDLSRPYTAPAYISLLST
jgi:FkbH-like protein